MHVGEQDTPLISVSSSNPNLGLPPAPGAFRTVLEWNTSNPLFAPAVYTTAIKLMYGLSQQAWYSTVELERSGLAVQHSPGVIIYTKDNPYSTSLSTELLVHAVYEIVFAMAEQRPGFFEVTSQMTWGGQSIGEILIDSLPMPTSNSSDFLNVTSKVDGKSVIDGGQANSGEIIDPDDGRFKISYQYHGSDIPIEEMLSAVFDGLTEVAPYNEDGPCPIITANSVNGKSGVHIAPIRGQVLLGWHVSRAFYLLFYNLFLVERIFREMQFNLLYYGTVIAHGYIFKMRSAVGEE